MRRNWKQLLLKVEYLRDGGWTLANACKAVGLSTSSYWQWLVRREEREIKAILGGGPVKKARGEKK